MLDRGEPLAMSTVSNDGTKLPLTSWTRKRIVDWGRTPPLNPIEEYAERNMDADKFVGATKPGQLAMRDALCQQ